MRKHLSIFLAWLLIGVFPTFVVPPPAMATTRTAASCSAPDVNAAIALSSNGDTVLVPGGTCTWDTSANAVTISSSKQITLNGQGITTINFAGSGTNPGGNALSVTAGASNNTFVTGFNFVGSYINGGCPIGLNTGTLPFRFYSNTLSDGVTNNPATLICVNGIGPGLIDHNSFTTTESADEVIHNLGVMDGSGWTTDVVPGGPNMIFIETNTFTNPNPHTDSSAVQNYNGARVVFRYNTLGLSFFPDAHAAGAVSGARWWEVYGNASNVQGSATYNQSTYADMRGGSGVYWGNTSTGNVFQTTNLPGIKIGPLPGSSDPQSGPWPINWQIGRGINQTYSPAYIWGNPTYLNPTPGSTNPPYVQIGPTPSSSSCVANATTGHAASVCDAVFGGTTQPTTLLRCESAADVVAGCPVSYNYVPYPYPHPLTGAPVIGFSPSPAAFGNQGVGTTSSPLTITVSNTGNAPQVMATPYFTITGANANSFANAGTGTCVNGGTVAVSGSCTVKLTFTPSTTGALSATLTINGTASGTDSLTGTGVAPAISFLPSPASFGNQAVGTTSGPLTVTVSNTGTASEILSTPYFTITGTNAADFANAGTGSCANGGTIAASSSCTVNLTVTPGGQGARVAQFNLSGTVNGVVSLAAVGTQAVVSLSPSSVSFANQNTGSSSGNQTVTLTNTGNATLTISSIALTGANANQFSTNGSTCGGTLAASASCSINTVFSPTSIGAKVAALTYTTSAASSPNNVPLSGTGVTPGTPSLSFSPSPVAFGNQNIGTTTFPITVTVSNVGNASEVLSTPYFSISGTNPTNFANAGTGTCANGATIAASGSCTINLTFTPSATGARSAVLTVSGTVSATDTLTGTGTQGIITITPSPIAFGNQNVGTTSAPTTVTLTNTGTGNATVSGITITGTNSSDFSATPTTLTPSGPITITGQNGTVISGKRITSTTGNCVTINGGSTNITIKQSEIGPCTGGSEANGIRISGGTTINIYDNYIHQTNSSGTCCDTHDGIFATNGISGLNIQGNVIAYGEANIEVEDSSNISVIGNFFVNPLDSNPSSPPNTQSRGQNFQCWQGGSSTGCTTVTFQNNYALSSPDTVTYAFAGNQEDSVNFGFTNGATVSGNYVTGGTSPSGCGMIADNSANSINFGTNRLLNTGQCGIGIADGTNNVVNANKIYNFMPVAGGGNTAIYAWKIYTAPCGPTTISNNIADALAIGGAHNTYFDGGGCSPTLSGNTFDAAADSSLTPVATVFAPPSIPPAPSSCAVASPFTNNSSSAGCSLPTSIGPGGSITVPVTFTPGAAGSRTATFNVQGTAPASAPLTGTGIASVVTLAPTSIAFPNQNTGTTSTNVSVSLTNTGTATLNISSITLTGANANQFGTNGSTCGSTLAASASCSLNVTFSPTTIGAKSANLTFTTDAASSPNNVPLTGTGTSAGTPSLSFSPTPVSFSQQAVGTTSPATTVTVSNTGTANEVLGTPYFSFTGANATSFAVGTGGTCTNGMTILPTSSCTVNVTFTPATTGSLVGVLNIMGTVNGSNNLSGTGGPLPGVTLSPTSINFGNQAAGTTSGPTNVRLTNTGGATLTITSILVTGANATEFSINTSTCGPTLAASAFCTWNVVFSPATAASKTAAVTVTTNASSSPDTVSLQGTGTAPVTPTTPAPAITIVSILPPGSAVVSAPGFGVTPRNVLASPVGCSSDGVTYRNPCVFSFSCGNCGNSTVVTFNGTKVKSSYSGGILTASVPIALIPVPKTQTDYQFEILN